MMQRRPNKRILAHGVYLLLPPSLYGHEEQLKASLLELVEGLEVVYCDISKASNGAIFGQVLVTKEAHAKQLIEEVKHVRVKGCSMELRPLSTSFAPLLTRDDELVNDEKNQNTELPQSVKVVCNTKDCTVYVRGQVTLQFRVTNHGTFNEFLERITFTCNGSPTARVLPRTTYRGILEKAGGTLTVDLKIRGADTPRRMETFAICLRFKGRKERTVPFGVRTISRARTPAEDTPADGAAWSHVEEPEFEYDRVRRSVVPAFTDARPNPSNVQSEVYTDWVKTLKEFAVPDDIRRDLTLGEHYKSAKVWNNPKNYQRRLHHLLWVEEAKQHVNIRRFDLKGIKVEGPLESYQKGGRFHYPHKKYPVLRIPVPGLSEGRPTVMAHDQLFCWVAGTEDEEFEGWVMHVEKDSVLVHCCEDFHLRHDLARTAFNVRFVLPRLPFRQMHHAIDEVDHLVVWPREWEEAPQPEYQGDRTLGSPQQRNAIARITAGSPGVPIQLSGAFGTGKTHTLFSAVRWLLLNRPSARILLCAETNSAADAFVKRIVAEADLAPHHKDVLRQYAFRFPRYRIPVDIQPFARYVQPEGVCYPPLPDLKKFRLVVSTVHATSALYGIGIKKNHWTHIIIDEAAQMMEAKVLMPLTMANRDKTTLVFAGDVKQVGPKLESPSAIQHGLHHSIMERDFFCYKYELLENYRNHPKILELPSKWFYESRLIPKGSSTLTSKNQEAWKKVGIKNPECPVVFAGVSGEEAQESDSPSYYNEEEAIFVCDLVDKVVRANLIDQRDIAVVAPYRKQIEKLRQLLRNKGNGGVDVGPLDSMQGREKEAVFISTVRSSRRRSGTGGHANIGFVGEPRRLNTAMTRAIGLLVVIGDPDCAIQDPHLKEYFDFCCAHNSVIGNCSSQADATAAGGAGGSATAAAAADLEFPPLASASTSVEEFPPLRATVKKSPQRPVKAQKAPAKAVHAAGAAPALAQPHVPKPQSPQQATPPLQQPPQARTERPPQPKPQPQVQPQAKSAEARQLAPDEKSGAGGVAQPEAEPVSEQAHVGSAQARAVRGPDAEAAGGAMPLSMVDPRRGEEVLAGPPGISSAGFGGGGGGLYGPDLGGHSHFYGGQHPQHPQHPGAGQMRFNSFGEGGPPGHFADSFRQPHPSQLQQGVAQHPHHPSQQPLPANASAQRGFEDAPLEYGHPHSMEGDLFSRPFGIIGDYREKPGGYPEPFYGYDSYGMGGSPMYGAGQPPLDHPMPFRGGPAEPHPRGVMGGEGGPMLGMPPYQDMGGRMAQPQEPFREIPMRADESFREIASYKGEVLLEQTDASCVLPFIVQEIRGEFAFSITVCHPGFQFPDSPEQVQCKNNVYVIPLRRITSGTGIVSMNGSPDDVEVVSIRAHIPLDLEYESAKFFTSPDPDERWYFTIKVPPGRMKPPLFGRTRAPISQFS